MTEFGLDIAFTADAQTVNPSLPIAPAFGWSVKRGINWFGEGQRPRGRSEQMSLGDTLRVTIVDASKTATGVDRVTLTFSPGPTAAPGQAPSPIEVTNPLQLDPWASLFSHGCNINGNGASTAGFPVVNEGDFELTVSFRAGNKTFELDPEMEVIGGK